MKTLLLTVSYSDPTDKFWAESYLKNTPVKQLEGETIHGTIKRTVSEIDGCELSYKGKPISDMFKDKIDGSAVLIGYVYRGKIEIDNQDNGRNWKAVNFDVWVEIKEVLEPELKSCEQ